MNHVNDEEAEDAPGVIFGEFLLQSALASVLGEPVHPEYDIYPFGSEDY